MLNNLNSSISGDGKLTGSLQVNDGMSIKAVLSQQLGITGSIGTMNLYDYYTKEEIHKLFGTIVTLKKESYFNFPNVGDDGTLYVDVSQNSTYIWDSISMSYQCIGRDYEKIQQINGGTANE